MPVAWADPRSASRRRRAHPAPSTAAATRKSTSPDRRVIAPTIPGDPPLVFRRNTAFRVRRNPRSGVDRLTLVAQRKSAALRRQRSLVRLQPGVSRGRSSVGRAPGRHPGEARSIRAVRFSKACGVTGARRAPTSSVRVRPLAGLFQERRRGPERPGYLWRTDAEHQPVRFEPAIRTHSTTATQSLRGESRGSSPALLRAGGVPLSTPNRRTQVRILPGAFAPR